VKNSSDRILTTHVGSLPRAARLSELLIQREDGQPIDAGELDRLAAEGVRDVLSRQVAAGVDVVNDGEQPRVGFQTYVAQRLEGYGGASERDGFKDMTDYPDFLEMLFKRMTTAKVMDAPKAIAEVDYVDLGPAERECDMFGAALKEHEGRYTETFMTAASPGIVCTTLRNGFYDSHEAYVRAVAREMKKEYELIHQRGYLLQLDCPDLAMERHCMFQNNTTAEFCDVVALHIDAINSAVENIPADRIRLHVCWGNYDGPHDSDVPMEAILPILYDANIGALSLEFANPRHQHEYAALRRHPLPDSMLLIPGVVDSTINYLEHPEVVCNRILEAVDAVGDRSRVLAGSDCGFGTFAGWELIAPSVAWKKFDVLVEGARLASGRLWG
jgi:5-methyltetrahydropteroyltriglutamate--homocysteine methyltransferase